MFRSFEESFYASYLIFRYALGLRYYLEYEQRNMYSPSRLNEMNATLTGQKAPKMDATTLRASHRKFTANLACGCSVTLATRTAATKAYCSNRSVENLTRVAIADLKINIPAKGSYLLLRTIEAPNQVNGIMTIVEDHTGGVFLFTAYNLVSFEMERDPDSVLPVGTIFILKEPFLKPGLSGDFLIRSDSPSDVIIITRNHKLYELTKDVKWKNKIALKRSVKPKTAEGWKKQGNEYFLDKKYLPAIDSYLSAFTLLNPKDQQLKVLLFLNIASTHLILKQFEAALEYALKALNLDTTNIKGLYRAGRAHYHLHQFEMARNYFVKLTTIEPNHPEGSKELNKTRKRLQETEGQVNIGDLYQISKSNPRVPIDCADYVGPLEIVSSSEKRRLVRATEDIQPGTMLVVSKALVSVFHDPGQNLPYDVQPDETVTLGEIAKAVQETCHLIYNNPKTFGALLYDLPINDAFLDEVRPNPFCEEGTCLEPFVDVERVRRILTTNGVPVSNSYRPVGLVSGQPSSCALFHFPSYINHSCLANAAWSTYNDIMVVHAIKPIKANEEVTIPYIDPLTRYSLKQQDFNKREFQCNCRLCESDRSIPSQKRAQIEDLILGLEKLIEKTAKSGTKVSSTYRNQVRKVVNRIDKLISDTGSKELRFYSALPYFSLSTVTSTLDMKEAVQILWKAISALGFDGESLDSWIGGKENVVVPADALFSNVILEFLMYLVLYHEALGRDAESAKYLRILEAGHIMYRGATKEMIRDSLASLHPDIPA